MCFPAEPPPILELVAGDVPFSVVGPLPAAPAPTVFIFALDRRKTLQTSSFNRSGLMLRDSRGFLCVSLDMPAHGDDARPGEHAGLPGWRSRLLNNENIVDQFVARVTTVLNHLVSHGYADRSRVAVIGISRGGFMGLHLMAANPDIRAVAAIAPAMNLALHDAFRGLEDHPLAQSLALRQIASQPNLQKPIWILVGNNDAKGVRTNLCSDFVRAVADAAPEGTKFRPVELHVVPGDDHRQPPNTHESAAAWVSRVIQ